MSDLRSRTIRLASSFPQGSPVRKALIAALSRKAVLSDGPIGQVLDRGAWNSIHDIQHELEQTARDYDDAAHFMGGPAEKEAKEMLKEIKKVTEALEDIAMGLFNGLVEAEMSFMQKYGDPADYSDKMRKETFPR